MRHPPLRWLLEEVLNHVANRCRPARWYSLAGAPRVDPLDQPRLDPNVNISSFLFHAGEMGRFGERRLIILAKNLIDDGPLSGGSLSTWLRSQFSAFNGSLFHSSRAKKACLVRPVRMRSRAGSRAQRRYQRN